MTKRQQRMVAVAALLIGIGIAAALAFTAFRRNMMYFYTPSDLVAHTVPTDAKLRLGGLVVAGTVQRGAGLEVSFTLADCTESVPVHYTGILPDLFREGQGIVATGRLKPDGSFVADEVLAKHDENYMPPELAKSLKTADGKHSCAPFKSVSGAFHEMPRAGSRLPA
ncbi:cytochrome c maturation protein CcmE [Fontimonas sp. SYSU GA230001]|uniref:cytochrome c maturation protein CcmE n=1 Tax=Fontimonas sp. SYSU GA230001 TaxID=3142450 RepID=UPI0032B3FF1C